LNLSVAEIANLIDGEVEGRSSLIINRLSKIEEGGENSLSFLANPAYISHLYTTTSSAVIVNHDFMPTQKMSCSLIRVKNAYEGFAKILEIFNHNKIDEKGISLQACIDETVLLGKDAFVSAFVFIGKNVKIGDGVKLCAHVFLGDNVIIGNHTTLYPGVKIMANCKIGSHCVLHSGVVVGSDGFGFVPQNGNAFSKVPQAGNVIIEDKVEIGSNTSIDRATIGSTIIRRGVKLDNLIQIAHNVEIGENTVIAAQTGVSGSTKIGKDCMIGGQVGIVGHITIADKVKIAAQSGVMTSILNEGEVVQGAPAFGKLSYTKSYVIFKKLPDLNSKILQLEKTIEKLKQFISQ
jgi:UDP-3-O-[3-hydroxymyristoyl] glucosamine N-acyltransferase